MGDGGPVIPVADVEARHQETRVREGVLSHLPPSVEESIDAPGIRWAGIEDEGRIVEWVFREIRRLGGESVRKGRTVSERELGQGRDSLALRESASQGFLQDFARLSNGLFLFGGEAYSRHCVYMHTSKRICSFRWGRLEIGLGSDSSDDLIHCGHGPREGIRRLAREAAA